MQNKGNGVWAPGGSKLWEGKHMGKLMKYNNYFSKIYLCRLISMPLSVFSDKDCSLPGPGEGRGNSIKKENLHPAFGQMGEGTELFLCLLLLNCLQLKTSFMPKWNIWGGILGPPSQLKTAGHIQLLNCLLASLAFCWVWLCSLINYLF